MIEKLNFKNKEILNALSILGSHFKINPKIGGEYSEVFFG